jgi:hypothetical protein
MGDIYTVAMIYIPSFIKIGSGIQKLIGGIHRHTGRRSHKPTLRKEVNMGIRKWKLVVVFCIEYE